MREPHLRKSLHKIWLQASLESIFFSFCFLFFNLLSFLSFSLYFSFPFFFVFWSMIIFLCISLVLPYALSLVESVFLHICIISSWLQQFLSLSLILLNVISLTRTSQVFCPVGFYWNLEFSLPFFFSHSWCMFSQCGDNLALTI